MAKQELITASDLNAQGWEDATFPLVCETCLGDNPYVRMIKSHMGKECKICSRPYTAFRWQPGRKARHKTTIVCQTCARFKNVCQVCLFDLEYGLPVQVRDKLLVDSGVQQCVALPESNVNRDHMLINTDPSSLPYYQGERSPGEGGSRGPRPPHPLLLKLARSQPYYKRNRARVCTFWQRGECGRGAACPFRHEVDADHDPALGDQNIRDRFMGVDDPVAQKIFRRLKEHQTGTPEHGNASSSSTVLPPSSGTNSKLSKHPSASNFARGAPPSSSSSSASS